MFGVARLNTLAAAMAAPGATYVAATGGTISFVSESSTFYKVHTFGSTGSFVVTAGGTADALIVGGGGPGGGGSTYRTGGGGGGGRVQTLTGTTITPQTYSVTVGAAQTTANTVGNSSSIFGTTSVGGGAGGATGVGQAGGAAGGGGGAANTSGLGESAGGTGTFGGGLARINNSNFLGGGGGGGSNTAAGGAAGGTAGAGTGVGGIGANGVTVTGFSSSSEVFGGGGGGSGSSSGGSGGTGGGGGASTGNGTAGTANTGGGGGGSASGGSASTVAAGGSGVVKVRYPIDPAVFAVVGFISSNVTSGATITIPTIQAGDLVFFFSMGSAGTTAPTAIAPSGWTAIGNISTNSTIAIRQQSFYKIMDGSESGTSLTTLAGANGRQSRLWIYRPNKAITTVTISSLAQQASISVPTAQSKPLSTTTGLFLCFAQHSSYASGPNPSSTSTPTRAFADGIHTIRSFETNYSGITWVDQSISMTDSGTNAMTSFIAQIA